MPPKSENPSGALPMSQKDPSGLNAARFVCATPPVPSATMTVAKIPSASKMVVSFVVSNPPSQPRQNIRSRIIFRVADDRHAPAVGSYHVTLRHTVFRVISAFRVDVRLQSQQQLFNGRFVENGHISHRFKRIHKFS